MDGHQIVSDSEGRSRCRLILPDIRLLSGRYHCNVFTTDESSFQAFHSSDRAVSFEVSNPGRDRGLVKLQHRWE